MKKNQAYNSNYNKGKGLLKRVPRNMKVVSGKDNKLLQYLNVELDHTLLMIAAGVENKM